MTPSVRVDRVGKQYVLGGSYPTGHLRDRLVAATHSLTRVFSGRGSSARAQRPTLWAVRDVSFELGQGEVLGIVGGNGSGKSTLLKVLSRITDPTEGRAEIRGRVGSLLEVGTGFHPDLTGRENIFLNGAILGMRRAEISRNFDNIVEFAEVAKFIDTPVRHYSSGMQMRLAFAVAAHLETEILMIDEVLAVGDLAFQRRCLGKMDALVRSGRTILFVSHNLDAMQRLCTSGLLLKQGTVIKHGSIEDVLSTYRAQVGPGSQLGRFSAHGRSIRGWAQTMDVRMLDARGATCGSLPADADLRFEIDVQVAEGHDQSLRGLVVEVSIGTEEGVPLLHLMNADDPGLELPSTRACRLSVTIPGPVLAPGRYRVSMTIGVPGLLHEDEVRDALEFQIDAPVRPWRPSALQASKGLTCRIGAWALSRVEEPATHVNR
jgi:lipopolysaccharide transport system ATP-binding protein